MLEEMRRGNIAVCALVAIATFGAGGAQAAKPLHTLSRAQLSLLSAINSARAAAGVAPLRASPPLTSAASWQSRALARAGYLDHTAPDGSTLIQRLQRVRWSGTAAGEDLAVAGAPGDAVAMWLQSPGHRENLLRPSFRTVGLGLARGTWNGREALYVTADFGS
jgi:uncharacterized protein YkwD